MRRTSANTLLDRFVRAVHRRHVVLHVVERGAVGLGIGAVLAAVCVGVCLWRGSDGTVVALVLVALGLLGGIVLGLQNLPGVLTSAAEADRQLGTHDLVATAWTARGDFTAKDDAFGRTVLALAEARCAALSPSAVILRKLGVRAWGGVALSLSLVVTLVMLSSESARVRAASVNRGTAASVAPDRRGASDRPLVRINEADSNPRPTHIERNPEDPDRSMTSETVEQANSRETRAGTPNRNSNNTASSEANAGAGSAQTKDPLNGVRQTVPSDTAAQGANSTTGDAAGGVGRAGTGVEGTDRATGGTLVSRPITVPPWRQPASWRNSVEGARNALQSGRVPDASRDLVRGYFDPAAGEQTHP